MGQENNPKTGTFPFSLIESQCALQAALESVWSTRPRNF